MLRLPERLMIAMPQVTIPSVNQSYSPHLDFLVLYTTRSGGFVWIDLEADGRTDHDGREVEHARRIRGLGLTRLGYEMSHIFADEFPARLLADADRILRSRARRQTDESTL